MVRIPGSHPGGPGSIPGVGNLFRETFLGKLGLRLGLILGDWDYDFNSQIEIGTGT